MFALKNIVRSVRTSNDCCLCLSLQKFPAYCTNTKQTNVEAVRNDHNLHRKVMQEVNEEVATRREVTPTDTSIVLFPGQGVQYVGMGKELLRFPSARDIFSLANEILKFDLLKLCLEGPRGKLNRTEYAQLAVMVTSLASLEKLREERPNAIDNCVATAGFSLGEITALVFAGALPFDVAVKLVQIRGKAMQTACEKVEGGMALVLYSPQTNITQACVAAQQWCMDNGVESPYCNVANYMYPDCKVIAGNIKALEFLEKNTTHLKIKRIKRLPVSGAFHTPLMNSAIEPLKRALEAIRVEDPIIHVYSNVDAKVYRNASHVARQLPKQMVRPVKWEQTMHALYERPDGKAFPRTFECGPGTGLIQVLRKVNAKAADVAYGITA